LRRSCIIYIEDVKNHHLLTDPTPQLLTKKNRRDVRGARSNFDGAKTPTAFVGVASLRRNFVQQHIKISLSRAFLEMSQVRVFA